MPPTGNFAIDNNRFHVFDRNTFSYPLLQGLGLFFYLQAEKKETGQVMAVIATITLNPSIDRTLEIDRLVVGGMNRVKSKVDHPSGKGINVSRDLSLWGFPTEALTMVGGDSGRWLVQALEEQNIPVDFVEVEGETRINVKIWAAKENQSTEVNEPGPVVTQRELEELLAQVRAKASRWDWVVISGSAPPGTPPGFYAELVKTARDQGAQTALDASGAALREGLKACPDLIKPNETEVRDILGWEPEDEAGALRAIEELLSLGIGCVMLTLGKAGGYVGRNGEIWQGIPPEVDVKTTVGCGDAALAGMVWALREGKGLDDALAWAMAAGAAAATTWGTEPPAWSLVEELRPKVRCIRHR